MDLSSSLRPSLSAAPPEKPLRPAVAIRAELGLRRDPVGRGGDSVDEPGNGETNLTKVYVVYNFYVLWIDVELFVLR